MKKIWMLLLCLMMALTTGVALADEVPAELLGSWNMTSVEDNYFPEGTTINMLFTESEITMTIGFDGYTESATMPYTVEGNTIIVNDVVDEYRIEGDTLWLTEEGTTIIFTREGAEVVELLWEEGSILGPWDVVEFFGDEDTAQSMELIKAMGGSVTVTFTETEMTLAMSFFGETMEETTEYVVVDNTIVAGEGDPVAFVLDGTTLTIGSEEEAGMLLQRPDVVNAAPADPAETPVNDSPIIGKWNLVDTVGEGPTGQYFDMGAAIEVEFTETELILTVSMSGYTESISMPIEIEADQIVFEDVSEKYEIEGNTLTLYEATETLIFERK